MMLTPREIISADATIIHVDPGITLTHHQGDDVIDMCLTHPWIGQHVSQQRLAFEENEDTFEASFRAAVEAALKPE